MCAGKKRVNRLLSLGVLRAMMIGQINTHTPHLYMKGATVAVLGWLCCCCWGS